jgi:hypothetical protein
MRQHRDMRVNRSFALASLAALLTLAASPARAQHACDAADEPGWRVVASTEIAAVRDGAPTRAPGGDWFVERTTTLIPMCTYFNPSGVYSLRTYSLDPFERTERVTICRGGEPVAPYSGPCPP